MTWDALLNDTLEASDADSFTEARARAINKIETELASPSKRALGVFIQAVDHLAVNFGSHGVSLVHYRQESGWCELLDSLFYRELFNRLCVARPNHVPDSGELNLLALTCCHAIAMHQDEIANASGELLLAQLEFIHRRNTIVSSLAWFAAYLFARSKGRQPKVLDTTSNFGPYLNALNISASEEFSASVKKLWEYHLSRVDDPFDNEFPEFEVAPYDVFAAELLAYRQVLAKDGIINTSSSEIAIFNHPLSAVPNINRKEPMLVCKVKSWLNGETQSSE